MGSEMCIRDRFGVVYSVVLVGAIAVLQPSSPFVLVGLLMAYLAAGVLSALLGLAFAARFPHQPPFMVISH